LFLVPCIHIFQSHIYIHNLVFTKRHSHLLGPGLYWHTNLHHPFPIIVTLFIPPDLMVKCYFIFFVSIIQTMSQKRPHSLNFQFLLFLSTSIFVLGNLCSMERDSVVTKATHYRLDSLGIKSQWGQGFPHPSRLAMGPTQPPSQ
jgi:hypothetical protein